MRYSARRPGEYRGFFLLPHSYPVFRCPTLLISIKPFHYGNSEFGTVFEYIGSACSGCVPCCRSFSSISTDSSGGVHDSQIHPQIEYEIVGMITSRGEGLFGEVFAQQVHQSSNLLQLLCIWIVLVGRDVSILCHGAIARTLTLQLVGIHDASLFMCYLLTAVVLV